MRLRINAQAGTAHLCLQILCYRFPSRLCILRFLARPSGSPRIEGGKLNPQPCASTLAWCSSERQMSHSRDDVSVLVALLKMPSANIDLVSLWLRWMVWYSAVPKSPLPEPIACLMSKLPGSGENGITSSGDGMIAMKVKTSPLRHI